MNPHIYTTTRKGEDYAAVFRERSDGDWDFVAMVALEESTMPMLSQADSDQSMALLNTIAEAIVAEGDDALIDFFGDPDCPSIYEWTMPTTPPPEAPKPEPKKKKK